MTLSRRILAICIGLYFVGQLLFLINIQFPRGQNFDEFHYVPSAKQFIHMQVNQNWEHPPLGKEIMAVGIAVWGDRPIGWRFMSTIFGALTLVGMFLWGFALFRDERTALWVALITLVNQLLYVQARIGMLDTFMMAFLVWGAAAFCASFEPDVSPMAGRRLLGFTGLMLGLATACKWFGVIAWAAFIGLAVLVHILRHWRTRFDDARPSDWYHPDSWKGITPMDWVLCLGVIPLIAYFATFLPYFFIPGETPHGFWDLFFMQKKMYEGQLRVVSSHPYMSNWSDWPLMRRPIWYAFDKEGNQGEWVRGVILLGNPFMMVTGLIALAGCLWGWVVERRRDAFLILLFFAAYFGSWVVIPRKISFYYYYYPAGMTLSLALAYIFHHGEAGKAFKFQWARWLYFGVALGFFCYFYPILSAHRIPSDAFRKWMWLSSWI